MQGRPKPTSLTFEPIACACHHATRSYSNRDLLGVRHRRLRPKSTEKRNPVFITARRRSQQRLGSIIAEVALTSDGRRATTLRDFGRRLVSIRRTCELQPFIRKAEPDKPIPLGPSEAGELATIIGLQAQLVASFEARKDFSARRHAEQTLHPIVPLVVSPNPHPRLSSQHA